MMMVRKLLYEPGKVKTQWIHIELNELI
jgi:hypothetical protein